jgi:hypothetical protein
MALLAPEIRMLRDPDLADETEQWFRDEVLHRLSRMLTPLGIDVLRLVREIELQPDLSEEYWDRAWANESRPYIAVFPHTTRDAVEKARRLIQDEILSEEGFVGPSRGRRRRDALESEEVARLRSQHSEAEVAEILGWPLTADEYGNPRRSPRVRRYAADAKKAPLPDQNFAE